jgi:hypothetical protein
MVDGFIQRLTQLGPKQLLYSYDTIIAIIFFIAIGFLTNWHIDYCTKADPLLQSFITISATFFSIILAAFALFSAFTNEKYVLAWIETKQFDKIVTIFQYNLYIPIFVLLLSLLLKYVLYLDILMIATISIFVYMIFSLLDLVGFIGKYILQKGEFLEITNSLSEKKE